MEPNIEQDYIQFLVYGILYKEYNLARFNHKNKHYSVVPILDWLTKSP